MCCILKIPNLYSNSLQRKFHIAILTDRGIVQTKLQSWVFKVWFGLVWLGGCLFFNNIIYRLNLIATIEDNAQSKPVSSDVFIFYVSNSLCYTVYFFLVSIYL